MMADVVQDVLSGNTSSLQHVWSQVGITSTYVTSPSGALNALEVVSAASLFLLISTLGSSYRNLSLLQLVSFSYSLLGLHMLCVGLISVQFTYVITNTIYYVCFNYGAALAYLVCAIFAISIGLNPLKTTTSLVSVALALACMFLHFGHGVYWSKSAPTSAPLIGVTELPADRTSTMMA
nr:uncharacterized protein LOC119159846 [Rhipicephalus microplus]